jgi:hypothetical protein
VQQVLLVRVDVRELLHDQLPRKALEVRHRQALHEVEPLAEQRSQRLALALMPILALRAAEPRTVPRLVVVAESLQEERLLTVPELVQALDQESVLQQLLRGDTHLVVSARAQDAHDVVQLGLTLA